MISYAQNAEDVLLTRFFADEPILPYVDVGAGHPSFHSVTKHFYDSGWSGINIEPRPGQYDRLVAERTRDINIRKCVSSKPGEMAFFEVVVEGDSGTDKGGLSTLDPVLAENYEKLGYQVSEYPVEVDTLSNLMETEAIEGISFLKIDVEGGEMGVIDGMDWNRWRPRIVVIECTLPNTDQLVDSELSSAMVGRDYSLGFFDGLNQFFVRNEDCERLHLLNRPANVFDCFEYARHVEMQAELYTRQCIIDDLEKRLLEQEESIKRLEESLAHHSFEDQEQRDSGSSGNAAA